MEKEENQIISNHRVKPKLYRHGRGSRESSQQSIKPDLSMDSLRSQLYCTVFGTGIL